MSLDTRYPNGHTANMTVRVIDTHSHHPMRATADIVERVPAMTQRCTICAVEFSSKRRAKYCSPACSQRAYRRRQAEQRIADAAARRRTAEYQRHSAWTKLLRDEIPKLSGTQAQQVFHLLDRFGRLDGLPFEQLEAFPDPGK